MNSSSNSNSNSNSNRINKNTNTNDYLMIIMIILIMSTRMLTHSLRTPEIDVPLSGKAPEQESLTVNSPRGCINPRPFRVVKIHAVRIHVVRIPRSRNSGTALCPRGASRLKKRVGLGRKGFPDSYYANWACPLLLLFIRDMFLSLVVLLCLCLIVCMSACWTKVAETVSSARCCLSFAD